MPVNTSALLKTVISVAKVAAYSAVSGVVMYLTNHPSAMGFETVGVLSALYEAEKHISNWKDGGNAAS